MLKFLLLTYIFIGLFFLWNLALYTTILLFLFSYQWILHLRIQKHRLVVALTIRRIHHATSVLCLFKLDILFNLAVLKACIKPLYQPTASANPIFSLLTCISHDLTQGYRKIADLGLRKAEEYLIIDSA